MARYNYRDVRLDVPDEWEDRSVTAFSSPPKEGSRIAPNMVITRDSEKGTVTISEYADRQLVDLAKGLDGFKLLSKRPITLDGVPAVEMMILWRGSGEKVQQRTVCVAPYQDQIINITFTASEKEFPEANRNFESVLQTIKFP